jgi:hypothetical protein
VADTVEIVQPAFYPGLPFEAMSDGAARRLLTSARGAARYDAAINLAESGASMVQLELPAAVTGEADDELADSIVATIDRLTRRRATVADDGVERPLTADMIGVVCAHVSQVNAVKERLPRSSAGVLVETANRFQGLERSVMLVHHPLSGRSDADEFHLDAGRLCVMLTRHRVACFVFARAGIEEQLSRHAPSGDRVLGIDEDPEFEGWKSNLLVARALRERGRILNIR